MTTFFNSGTGTQGGNIVAPFQSGQPVTNSGTANLAALTRAADDLLNFKATMASTPFDIRASNLQAAGDLGEADAYGSAQKIAEQNAQLAGVAGTVQIAQQQRTAMRTIGAQQAQTAASGFANSGSAISMLRDSLQQSYLGKQLIEAQTGITQGGYLEAGAAATAEQQAAQTAAGVATELAGKQQESLDAATTNATNETGALTDYLKSVAPTPETQLVTDVITGGAAGNAISDLGKITGGGAPVFTGTGWAPAGTINPHTGKPFAL